MTELLSRPDYGYLSAADKEFVAAFDTAMNRLGYQCGGLVDGHCWGRHMAVYTRAGVKSKKSYARLYLRPEGLILRLYFSGVDKHREAVETAPPYIQEAFTGPFPACDHCQGKTECIHQKHYTLGGKAYEICDGKAFWFHGPTTARLPAYLQLFQAFYPARTGGYSFTDPQRRLKVNPKDLRK